MNRSQFARAIVILGSVVALGTAATACEKAQGPGETPDDPETTAVWNGQGDGESWSDSRNWSRDIVGATGFDIQDASVVADIDAFIPSATKVVMVNASITIARGRLMVNRGEISLANSAIATEREAWFRNEGRVEGSGTVTVDCNDGGSSLGLTAEGVQVVEMECLGAAGCKEFTFGAIKAGEEMAGQFESFVVSAVNGHGSHPDMVIGFNTSVPTGDDDDLITPGTGTGNTTSQCTALIIAENDVDANGDGLVDDPDDESCGGQFIFDFNGQHLVESIALLDIEEAGASVTLYNGEDEFHQADVPQLDDNSLQRMDLTGSAAATRMVVHIPSSGAIDDLRVCPAP